MSGLDEPRIRADFHSHTHFSSDGAMPPEVLVERAAAAGLDRIAVTDHGEIDGAFRAAEIDPARVIVGEEVRCRCGSELIGLFLRERIPMGLEVEDVAERIRDQGGLVYAPHPFAYATRPGWRGARVLAVADVAEAFNSRAFLPAWNRRAAAEGRSRGIALGAGSDAHFAWEVGRAHTLLPAFADAAGLRAALAGAEPVAVGLATPFIHGLSISLHALRILRHGRDAEGRITWKVPPS
jgi:predicted metal-dependent phosphoesterase TrpH